MEVADHLGGATAALVTGVALLPALGQGGTLALAAALMASLLVPTWFDARDACAAHAAHAARPHELWHALLPRRWRGVTSPLTTALWVAVALVVGVRWAATLHTTGPSRALNPGALAALGGDRAWRHVAVPFPHDRAPTSPPAPSPPRANPNPDNPDTSPPVVVAAAASAAINHRGGATALGYGGPVEVGVSVDTQGRLARVRVLASHESPAYLVGLDDFLKRLEGLEPREPLRVAGRLDAPAGEGEGDVIVDGITGATVTSRAVLRGAQATARALDRDALGLAVPAPAGVQEPAWWRPLTQPGALYLLLSALAAVGLAFASGRPAPAPTPSSSSSSSSSFSSLSRAASRLLTARRGRLALLAAHVVLGGWVLNVQLSTADLARLVTWELPGVQAGHVWVLLGVVGLTVVALGPLYCGWLCPFGAAQELVGELGARLGWRKRLSPGLDRALRAGKYALLAVVLGVVAALGVAGARMVLAADPLALGLGARAAGAALAVLALLALVAVASLFVERPWCRYGCPVGAALSVANALPWVRRAGRRRWGRRPKRYGACDLGVRGPRDPDCLQCDRCVLGGTGAAGTHEAAVATPRWRDRLAVVAAVVALGLVAWSAVSAGALQQGPGGRAAVEAIEALPKTEGEPRDVDMPALRRKLGAGYLSRHPARWSRPVGARPGAGRGAAE